MIFPIHATNIFRHQSRVHNKRYDNVFYCDVCHEPFNSRVTLEGHMKIHEKPTEPIPCELCKKPFKDVYRYEKHFPRKCNFYLLQKLPDTFRDLNFRIKAQSSRNKTCLTNFENA